MSIDITIPTELAERIRAYVPLLPTEHDIVLELAKYVPEPDPCQRLLDRGWVKVKPGNGHGNGYQYRTELFLFGVYHQPEGGLVVCAASMLGFQTERAMDFATMLVAAVPPE